MENSFEPSMHVPPLSSITRTPLCYQHHVRPPKPRQLPRFLPQPCLAITHNHQDYHPPLPLPPLCYHAVHAWPLLLPTFEGFCYFQCIYFGCNQTLENNDNIYVL